MPTSIQELMRPALRLNDGLDGLFVPLPDGPSSFDCQLQQGDRKVVSLERGQHGDAVLAVLSFPLASHERMWALNPSHLMGVLYVPNAYDSKKRVYVSGSNWQNVLYPVDLSQRSGLLRFGRVIDNSLPMNRVGGKAAFSGLFDEGDAFAFRDLSDRSVSRIHVEMKVDNDLDAGIARFEFTCPGQRDMDLSMWFLGGKNPTVDEQRFFAGAGMEKDILENSPHS